MPLNKETNQTAREVGTDSQVVYSNGPLHMAERKPGDQFYFMQFSLA